MRISCWENLSEDAPPRQKKSKLRPDPDIKGFARGTFVNSFLLAL
jgi:hypothetical protein